MAEDSGEILLTSRVRLARNIEGYPYPNQISNEMALELQDKIKKVLMADDRYQWKEWNLRDLHPIEALYKVEGHEISYQLLKHKEFSSLIQSTDGSISMMLMEEDHIRLQAMNKGMHLQEQYEKLLEISKILEKKLPISFHPRFGYLTACPTNVGTGLRASCMLHLPALHHFGLKDIERSIHRMGFVIRGMNGEGTESLGHVYQISNEKTLGLSEEEFIKRATSLINEIIVLEQRKRKELYLDHLIELEDMVNRSVGVLRNARILSFEEAIENLSHIQLGIELSVLKPKMPFNFYDELIAFQKAHLQMERGSYLDKKSSNIYRANRARKLMKEAF